MSITTVSSRDFARDLAQAKRATTAGPVFVTDRGKRVGKSNPSVAVRHWASGIPGNQLYLSSVSILELETGVLLMERKDAQQGQDASFLAARCNKGVLLTGTALREHHGGSMRCNACS